MKSIFKTIFFFFPSTVFEPFYFELKSFLGRVFQNSLKVDKSKTNFINLGCGPVINSEMINIDFFFEKGIDYGADLRYPLKIEDDSIDGIVCEHTMEHLTFKDDEKLMQECYRILKPGGVLRIILPDVSKFLNAYGNRNQNWFDEWENLYFTKSLNPERAKRRLSSKMGAISFVLQEYGHISAWDEETLNHFLSKVGFENVEVKSFREGAKKELLIDLDSETRKFVSIYIEAEK